MLDLREVQRGDVVWFKENGDVYLAAVERVYPHYADIEIFPYAVLFIENWENRLRTLVRPEYMAACPNGYNLLTLALKTARESRKIFHQKFEEKGEIFSPQLESSVVQAILKVAWEQGSA